jgi:hypothetical protein
MSNAKIVLGIVLMLLSCAFLQICQASEETSKDTYQSFLANVLSIDLTKYNIEKSGYGVSHPPITGGLIESETLSYTLSSPQGQVNTWCVIENGVIMGLRVNAVAKSGPIIYSQPQATNTIDAAKNFLEKLKTFSTEVYHVDNLYIEQAKLSLNNENAQAPVQKTEGNMQLTISPTSYDATFKWNYVQNGKVIPNKSISIEIVNNSVSWFADFWSRFSVINTNIISEEEAKAYAFLKVQEYNVTLASFQGENVVPVHFKPDWSHMTYEANLSWAPGNAANADPLAINTYNSSTVRDPLTLYPMWHFVFYFNKPIGNVVGFEANVWADTKELEMCREYGYLGSLPTTAPQQQQNTQLLPLYAISIIVGILTAIAISLLIVKKRKVRQQKQH